MKCATKTYKKLKIACLAILLNILWCFFYNFITRNTMSTMQRKRRGGAGRSARQTHKQRRLVGSSSRMAPHPEAIELVESAVEEVVDLTCESSDPVVVDLTHNDSVVIVDDNHRQRRNATSSHTDNSVLSSDEEDLSDIAVYITNNTSRALIAVEDGAMSSRSSGTVSCPICMDGYTEIVQSGRLIVSTKCGHVFCSQCLRDALRNVSSCPTCRKKLNHKQYHPIYI
ncbi:E3 ubiquitin-protein ligase RNF4 isoform X2 [Rhinatrema bivittatum]|nr:E3 ubiquitin-protein ligase RNF4 isoform X2 [Rhinatrema bivittatum]XP_029448070.1 E3 ubiquitin-protein ligase RNF4 isoform X2 [Rhinatrema bivittatum]